MHEHKINLKTIRNESFHVYAPGDASIKHLRERVSVAHNFAFDSIKICSNGAVLKDDATLRSISADGHTLVVVGKQIGVKGPPFQCSMNTPCPNAQHKLFFLKGRTCRCFFLPHHTVDHCGSVDPMP